MANLDHLRHANGSIPTAVHRLSMQKVPVTSQLPLVASVVVAHSNSSCFEQLSDMSIEWSDLIAGQLAMKSWQSISAR